MKLWIARNADNKLFLFQQEPCRNIKWGVFTSNDHSGRKVFMQYDIFPEVTWKNSPQQVEFKLIDNGNKD